MPQSIMCGTRSQVPMKPEVPIWAGDLGYWFCRPNGFLIPQNFVLHPDLGMGAQPEPSVASGCSERSVCPHLPPHFDALFLRAGDPGLMDLVLAWIDFDIELPAGSVHARRYESSDAPLALLGHRWGTGRRVYNRSVLPIWEDQRCYVRWRHGGCHRQGADMRAGSRDRLYLVLWWKWSRSWARRRRVGSGAEDA